MISKRDSFFFSRPVAGFSRLSSVGISLARYALARRQKRVARKITALFCARLSGLID